MRSRSIQIFGGDEQAKLPKVIVLLFIAICTSFSIAIGLLPYNPMIAIAAVVSICLIIGLLFFFNVSSFAIYIVPLLCFYGTSYLTLIITVLLFVSFLAWRLNIGDVSIDIAFPFWVIVLVLAGFSGLSRSIEYDMGRFYLIYTVLIPLFIFIVYYNLNPTTQQIRTTLTVLCVVAATLGFSSFIYNIIAGTPRQILTWGWGSQNRAASLFGMLLPVALVFLIDSRGKRDFYPRLVIFFGIMIGILTTQTRAILLSVFLAALYLGWRDRRVLKIMIPVILLALIVVPSLIISRMAMLFGQSAEVDWSSIGRVQIYLHSLELIPEYFLYGMGINSFDSIYPARYPFTFLKADHAHNVYLRWLFDFGIFGLLAFVGFVYGCLSRGHRAITRIKNNEWSIETRTLLGINGGIVCFLIGGLVESFLRDLRVSAVFWILLAFQLIIARRTREAKQIACG